MLEALRDFVGAVEVVVVNGCETRGFAQQLHQLGFPIVVGWEDPHTPSTQCATWARLFLEHLSEGLAYGDAFTAAREKCAASCGSGVDWIAVCMFAYDSERSPYCWLDIPGYRIPSPAPSQLSNVTLLSYVLHPSVPESSGSVVRVTEYGALLEAASSDARVLLLSATRCGPESSHSAIELQVGSSLVNLDEVEYCIKSMPRLKVVVLNGCSFLASTLLEQCPEVMFVSWNDTGRVLPEEILAQWHEADFAITIERRAESEACEWIITMGGSFSFTSQCLQSVGHDDNNSDSDDEQDSGEDDDDSEHRDGWGIPQSLASREGPIAHPGSSSTTASDDKTDAGRVYNSQGRARLTASARRSGRSRLRAFPRPGSAAIVDTGSAGFSPVPPPVHQALLVVGPLGREQVPSGTVTTKPLNHSIRCALQRMPTFSDRVLNIGRILPRSAVLSTLPWALA